MESRETSPGSEFVSIIGPVIESLLDACARQRNLDRHVANGVLTPLERRLRSVDILKEIDRLESDLAFWLPVDAINALHESMSFLIPTESQHRRVRQVIDEVWIALNVVMAREERIEMWKREQASQFPPAAE